MAWEHGDSAFHGSEGQEWCGISWKSHEICWIPWFSRRTRNPLRLNRKRQATATSGKPLFSPKRHFVKFPRIPPKSEIPKNQFLRKNLKFHGKYWFSWFRGIGSLRIINISLGILMILRVRRGDPHFMENHEISWKLWIFMKFHEKWINQGKAEFRKKQKRVKVEPGLQKVDPSHI